VSKEVSPRESKKPLTVRHAAAVAAVAVIGAIIAFWVLSSIVGIFFFFVKLAVVVALIAGVFWLLSRFRR
jgi:high-affinity Fe2+/Pb2+ permease